MNDLSIARRYARALNEEAAATNKTDVIDADVGAIEESFAGSRELGQFFESPIIPREKKKSVIEGLFESRVDPLTLRFMLLLVNKNRESIFPMVVRAYRELRDLQTGTVEASARVASELPKDAVNAMKDRLETLTGQSVRLNVDVDPSLLGGAVVRIGDTVYDGSVSNKLGALRSQMRQGSFNQN